MTTHSSLLVSHIYNALYAPHTISSQSCTALRLLLTTRSLTQPLAHFIHSSYSSHSPTHLPHSSHSASHPLARSLAHSSHSLTHLTHSLTHLTHSLTHLTHLTHSLTNSPTHSFTHWHSLTHSLRLESAGRPRVRASGVRSHSGWHPEGC